MSKKLKPGSIKSIRIGDDIYYPDTNSRNKNEPQSVTITIPMHSETNPLEFLKGKETKTLEQIIEESKNDR